MDVLTNHTPWPQQEQAFAFIIMVPRPDSHAAREAFALTFFVPRPDSHAARTILAGSAIVGRPDGGEFVLCDFEGNLHGAKNLKTHGARLRHAAGRHLTHYPTKARMAIPLADLIEVGRYDYETNSLFMVDDLDAQRAWGAWVRPPGPKRRSAGPGL